VIESALEGIVPADHISGNGFTIAVSEAKHITRIARRTVIGDSVLVPILEDVVGWEAARIRQLFASKGLALQQWDKARTDGSRRPCSRAPISSADR
jgi:hypothetical protein